MVCLRVVELHSFDVAFEEAEACSLVGRAVRLVQLRVADQEVRLVYKVVVHQVLENFVQLFERKVQNMTRCNNKKQNIKKGGQIESVIK